jgi:uncharacterized protein (TIGR00369 family)
VDLPDAIGGLDKALGVEVLEASGDRVVLEAPIGPQLLQPYGIVHGGVHCSLVESAASIGAAMWFGERGNVVGVANHTNFLRAAREGRLTATAEPIQRGRTQQLWRVTVTGDGEDAAGRPLAVGEVRLANIPDAGKLG